MYESDVRETRLENGIRVITERVPYVHSVALGIRVDAGSRDEAEAQAGISHVLEHMLFRGTERRSARDIAEEMDAVGGQIDAYTTKEHTGYSARVLPEHVPLAVDVLADMLLNSRLNDTDLELEKSVILEEYRSVEDAPEDYVHDVFGRTLWPSHPLGRPVIGSPDVIERLTPQELRDYLSSHYTPDRLICVAAGRLEHEAFAAEIERQFGHLKGSGPSRELSKPEAHLNEALIDRPTEQTHFCLGAAGYSESDPDRWAARVLNLILGGSMSSRLFQEIREKRGLCYSIGADHSCHREGGMVSVYADTSPQHLEQVRDLCCAELRKTATEGVTAVELDRAKQQVRAGTLMTLDDVVTRMSRLARSVMYHGRVIPLEELVAACEAVTLEDCRRVAQQLFGGDQYAFAAIGPFNRPRSRRRKASSASA